MKPASNSDLIPPTLAALPRAAASDRHLATAGKATGEALARMLERRKGNALPKGVTIRDLMTNGRA